ncbi:MAG: MrcB family domain-containing protein [Syntrophales bacterium]
MLPDISRDALLNAIRRYDTEFRDDPAQQGWESHGNQKFAIEHDGKLYPVKKVVSLATEVPVSGFSGGDEANGFVTARGFQVVDIAGRAPTIIRDFLGRLLTGYSTARTQQFKGHPIHKMFDGLSKLLLASEPVARRNGSKNTLRVVASAGKGNWARVPWIALMDSRETTSTQHGVYCVFLFRQDMSGVYVTFNQGVTDPKKTLGPSEGRKQLRSRAQELRMYCHHLAAEGYLLDNDIDLRTDKGLGADYEDSTVAYKLYETGRLPGDAQIIQDLEAVLEAYDRFLTNKPPTEPPKVPPPRPVPPFDLEAAVSSLIEAVGSAGFVFEPWQIATYVTALRTKPFVILAGISGTGKSKLPLLISEKSGGMCRMVPVRPDWTDSSEVLGYVSLDQNFHPGPLLQFAKDAEHRLDVHHVLVIDEMNLARVEHYFAEVLSRIEDRRRVDSGVYRSGPLWSGQALPSAVAQEWGSLGLPPNLAIVGTVNMDESAHGFSRKVLDRAFTLELSDVDLRQWQEAGAGVVQMATWPLKAWLPRAVRLGELTNVEPAERDAIEKVITTLSTVNGFLTPAQLQVGYRSRDEIALFVLNARDLPESFVTREQSSVDPLDIALEMKVLPRLVGGSNAIRTVLLRMLSWATDGKKPNGELLPSDLLKPWIGVGRPAQFGAAVFPRTAGRLCLMLERLENEGFTSFWL